MKICVVGNGAFGTAFTGKMARQRHATYQWCSTHDYPHLKQMLELQRMPVKENKLYLPGVELSNSIQFTDSFEPAKIADVVLLAQPTKFIWQSFYAVAGMIKENPKMTIALLSKGFDAGSRRALGAALEDYLRSGFKFYRFAVISGPTFARDLIAPEKKHTISVASYNLGAIKKLKEMAQGTGLTLRGTTDLSGVSWGGGLKNAYTIGYGLLEKRLGKELLFEYLLLSLQTEIKKFLEFAGARPETLWSPAVWEDYYMTARGDSRNRRFGQFLAEYHKPEEIKEHTRTNTVEGYEAMMILWEIAQENGLDIPLLHCIHAICDSEHGASPGTFVECFNRVKALSG